MTDLYTAEEVADKILELLDTNLEFRAILFNYILHKTMEEHGEEPVGSKK